VNVPVVPSHEQAGTVSGVFERLETLSIALLLVGIVAVFTVWAPSGTFLTRTNLENIALDTSQILILALGMTFLLIAAGIDLSIGSIVVFASVIGAKVMVALAGTTAQVENFQYPHLTLALLGGVSAAVVVGAAWGVFNGVVSVKLRMPPFIVTLATLGIALGIAQLLTGGLNVQNVPIPLQESFGLGSFAGLVPWPVVVAVGVTAALWILLRRTRFGLRTYAIGANAEAVRRAGVNVDRHVISLYGLMGVLCGIVGVIEVSRFGTATIAGHQQDALAAISAAVIGGTSLFGGRGRISGTIVGALIPAVLLNGFVIVGVEPFWQDVAVGSVLLVAVYLDQLRRRRSAVVQFV
jgi:ribose transport system permease protein